MLHKSKVVSLEYHNQFGESKEELSKKRADRKSEQSKDVRQGQSTFRIKEATKKQGS